MFRITVCTIIACLIALQAWAQDQEPKNPLPENGHAGSGARIVAPAEGGPRRWQVAAGEEIAMHASPAREAPVVGTLVDGAILSNLGCAPAGGIVWCRVRPLQGRVRGYVAADFLHPARGPDGNVPMGADDSAVRAGQGDFDASGSLACAQNRAQPMGRCTFGVARSSGGDATVVVTFSNGFKRLLFFAHGRFISGNATMSGNGFDTDWQRDGEHHIIRVDDQRYTLRHAEIFGS